mgnify:CR=1 FL=1
MHEPRIFMRGVCIQMHAPRTFRCVTCIHVHTQSLHTTLSPLSPSFLPLTMKSRQSGNAQCTKKTDKKFSEARTRLMGMASSLPYFATMSLHCAAVSSWFCSFLKNFCRSFAVSAVLFVAKRIMRTRATEVSGGKGRTTGVGNETQCVTVCLCLCLCLCASSLHPSLPTPECWTYFEAWLEYLRKSCVTFSFSTRWWYSCVNCSRLIMPC